MADCPEADKWRPLYQMAAVRREVLKRLQAGVDAHDDAGMVQWGSKRCLAKYPLPQPLAEAIAAARQRLGRSESLLTALANAAEGTERLGPMQPRPRCSPSKAAIARAKPHAQSVPDAAGPMPRPANRPRAPCPAAGIRRAVRRRAVRAQAERFAPIRRFWTMAPQRGAAAGEARAAPPADQPALSPVEEPEGHLRATGNGRRPASRKSAFWPSAPRNPRPATTPSSLPPIGASTIPPHNGAADGSGRLIPVEKGWEGSSVAVWAVVDLGFQKLFSPPLILGQIESRSRWKWPRLFSRRSGPEEPT